MTIKLGLVRDLVRYPVKSMAGTSTESAFFGCHGLAGDRRFGFRRLDDESRVRWLTARKVPELVLYQPLNFDESSCEPLPTHVRTPTGAEVEIHGNGLRDEIAGRFGSGVELMKITHGIFDVAAVSVISLSTIAGIGVEAGVDLDRRRFRANIFLDAVDPAPFVEDGWVGHTLLFGESEPKPAISISSRDERCMIINLDPNTAIQDAGVWKTVVRINEQTAGV